MKNVSASSPACMSTLFGFAFSSINLREIASRSAGSSDEKKCVASITLVISLSCDRARGRHRVGAILSTRPDMQWERQEEASRGQQRQAEAMGEWQGESGSRTRTCDGVRKSGAVLSAALMRTMRLSPPCVSIALSRLLPCGGC